MLSNEMIVNFDLPFFVTIILVIVIENVNKIKEQPLFHLLKILNTENLMDNVRTAGRVGMILTES